MPEADVAAWMRRLSLIRDFGGFALDIAKEATNIGGAASAPSAGGGMSSYWQRLIAALTIMLFAHGSVLASGPLVWCIGGSDHSLLEFGLGGGWHVNIALTAPHGATKAAKQLERHPGGCEDIDLLSPAASSAKQTVDLKAPAAAAPQGWRERTDTWPHLLTSGGLRGVPPPDRIAPRLVLLRTVFLLN